MERKCSTCQINKPYSAFVKAKNLKHGINYTCYECKKLQNEKITCDVCFKEVPKRYMTRHFKLEWHMKLDKFINKILCQNDELHSQLSQI